MPTENRSSTVSHFQREDRYIVIKRSDLDRLAGLDRHLFSQASRRAHEQMFAAGAPARSFLVIESDWPEFESTWAAIEARMTGKSAEQHQSEPLPAKPVLTLQMPDPYDDREGPWFDTAEIRELRKMPAGTKLYLHPPCADAGEAERLREALGCALKSAENINAEVIALSAKLVERDALLARILGKRDACTASYWFEEIQALLSASAEQEKEA